ncbi:MAG: hypothetical protein F6J86_27155 [Symploca sp. SIO1B1]|nr:hypothetical protein [Symploca sp. SIO1B1]
MKKYISQIGKQKYPPLLIRPDLVRNLRAIQTKAVQGEDARLTFGELLQSALQLEFATVNPYLSAAFSIKNDNREIYELIQRVAQEEMLHMTVVANLMNAIGIAPDILDVIPDYPFDLDVLDPSITINLSSLSFDLVEDLFMRIETPEDPTEYPSWKVGMEADEELPKTVGQFYQEIIELINSDVIPDLFENAERDVYKQIEVNPNFREIKYINNDDDHTYPLNEDIDFVIKDKETAVRHLTWIVSGGEGSDPSNPLNDEGLPGHYYRFESILKEKYLVKDKSGFSFSGGDLPFSQAGVHEFDGNAKVEDYADDERVERHMQRFNESYTDMINNLQIAFNCLSPEQEQQSKEAYDASIGIMRNMPTKATAIVQAAEGSSIKAGIPFQYLPSA